MKKKTGGMVLSLLLAGTMALNTLMLGNVRTAAYEDTTTVPENVSGTESGTSENDTPQPPPNVPDSSNNHENGGNDPVNGEDGNGEKEKENEPDVPPVKERRIVKIDDSVWKEKIARTKTYDGESHIGTQKFLNDDDYSIIFGLDTIKDGLYIYYEDANGERVNPDIFKIKIQGYYADDKGNPSADVVIDAEGEPTEKNIVITNIFFRKDKDKWKTIEDFFEELSDDTVIYDAEQLKGYCYSGSGFDAEAPYAAQGKIAPKPVSVVLNKDVVTHYYGQPFPTITSDNSNTYYYTLPEDMADRLEGTFELYGQENTVAARWKDTAPAKNNVNYTLSVVNIRQKPIDYQVNTWVPSAQPKIVNYEVEKQEDNTYQCYAILKFDSNNQNNYQLSADNAVDGTWSSRVKLPVDSQKAEVSYYIRNMNPKDAAYLAISSIKTMDVVPSIETKSKLYTQDDAGTNLFKIFLWQDDAYYTNKKVYIETTLTTTLPIEAELQYAYLSDSPDSTGKTRSVPIHASDWQPHNKGKYQQTKIIELPPPDNAADTYVILRVKTPHTEQANTIAIRLFSRTKEDNSYKEINKTDVVQFVIDTQTPQVTFSVSGNSTKYTAEVTDNTEILRVEYAWDNLSYHASSKTWKKTPENAVRVYADAKSHYDDESGKYVFDLTKEAGNILKNMPAADGKHILHIRVEDVAGNIHTASYTPDQGYDNVPPQLTRQCLVVADKKSKDGYRALTWNDLYAVDKTVFSNKSFKLLIQAEDAAGDTFGTSGMKSVSFNGTDVTEKNMTYQGEQWYAFDLTNEHRYYLKATLTDNAGNTKTVKLHETFNRLCIETGAPAITEMHLINAEGYITDDAIHSYNGENGYYNEALRLIVKAADKGTVVSDLRSVILHTSEKPDGSITADAPQKIRVFADQEDLIGKEEEWYTFDLACGGEYTLKVTAVDNSGNLSEERSFSEHFSHLILENQPPVIRKAILLKAVDEEHFAVLSDKDFTREGLHGFAHQDIRVMIVPDDKTESVYAGVSGVAYAGKNLEKMTLVYSRPKASTPAEDTEKTQDKPAEGGTEEVEETGYIADLTVGQQYALQFTVTDKAGNSNTVSLAELTGLSDLLLENDIPSVSVIKPQESIDHDDTTYCGILTQQNNIRVIVRTDKDVKLKEDTEQPSDKTVRSGMASYKIKDIWYHDTDQTTETILTEKTFEEGEAVYAEPIDFPMTQWTEQEGEHQLVIQVKDKSLNTFTYHSKKFFVDFTAPAEGRIITDNTEKSVVIDGVQWFDGGYVIDLTASFQEKNIDSITVNVEGAKTTEWQYVPNDKDYPVTVDETSNTIHFSLDNQQIPVNDKNTYQITVTATDLAGNQQTKEMTLRRDFDAPQITKVVVQELKDNTVVKVLRRTFGIFYNDGIQLIVHANDRKSSSYDSGMKEVTLSYEGLKEPLSLTYDPERKVYYAELLPLTNSQCFEKHLQLTAYDRFGKSSLASSEGYPNIDGTNNQSNLLLIERINPTIQFIMPEQDNKAGNTAQKWYSNHSDHVITLNVQDVHAGIRSMKVTINGKAITKDSDSKDFLTNAVTSAQTNRINAVQTYHLLTEYLAKQAGTQPTDGKYTLLAEVTDNAGNTAQQQTIFYRDVTAPKVESFTLIPNPQDRDNVINFGNAAELVQITDYGFYFRAKFNVVVSVSDQKPSAGLNRIQYTLVPVKGQKQSGETNITNGKASFDVDKDFKGQIYVSAFDYTQNESPTVTPEAFVIDTEQRHLSEPHITTTALPQTSYTDTDKKPLYTNTVTFSVQITDTVSGIKEFTYQTIAELNSVPEKKITINPKKTYLKGQNLGDGWFVQTVDRNLVTGVSRTYTFDKDDNNISVVWNMKDNANNNSALSYSPFTIDKTVPDIIVTFDGTQQYYSNNRPAKITIVERNFDEKRIQTSIKNSLKGKEGNIPAIHFTSVNNSKNRYEANFVFTEGDYTFAMQGTDRGNHPASVRYANANSQTFYVDATDPRFGGFGSLGSTPLVNSNQTVTLTVTEHNFDPNAITVTVNKDNTPTTHNDWTTTGDTHTMTITLSTDGVYTVSIGGEDKAGRKLSAVTSPRFEIDKTAPKITVRMDGDSDCYNTQRTGTITVVEKNFDAKQIQLQCQKDGQRTDIPGLTYQGTGNTHTASFTLDEGDYSFTTSGANSSVSGVDKAGNTAEISYEGRALDKFSVDATDPVFGGFNEEYTTGAKLFNEDQTLSLTVEEHNFSAETMTVSVHKDGAEIVPPHWKNSGDTHTMDMTFSDDGVYAVSISGTDKAGRAIVGKKDTPLACTFEIDKTKPQTDTDDATMVLTSDNAEEQSGIITFEDKNLKNVHGEVRREVYKKVTSSQADDPLIRHDLGDDNTISIELEASGTTRSINPYDYFVWTDENGNINTDKNGSPMEGIYTFTLTAEDRTSNQSAVLTKTYVIMNKGFLACIENSDPQEGTGYYAYAGEEKISKDRISNIMLVVYAQNDAGFQVKLENTTSNNDMVLYNSGKETRTTAYTEEQECTAVSPSITRYQLNVLDNIKEVLVPDGNHSDNLEGLLNVSLTGDNPPSQTLIAFKIDNKLPEGNPDEQQDYYGTSEANISIKNISNDVDIDNTIITDTFNGETITLKQDNGFRYNSSTGVITVTLKGQGSHNLSVKLKDKAGNVSTIEKTDIYIGSFMGKWWWLFLIGGLIIAGFIIALIVILTKRNKS